MEEEEECPKETREGGPRGRKKTRCIGCRGSQRSASKRRNGKAGSLLGGQTAGRLKGSPQPGEDPCGSGESESTAEALLLPAPSHAGDCIPGTDSEHRPLNTSEDAAEHSRKPRSPASSAPHRPRILRKATEILGDGKEKGLYLSHPTELGWRKRTLPLPESSLPGPAFPSHPHLTLLCPWRVSAAAREPQVHFLRLPWEGLKSPQAPGAKSAATPRIPATQGSVPESPPCLPCASLDAAGGSLGGRAKACVDQRLLE